MASLCIVIDVARKLKKMIIAKHAMTNCQQFMRKKYIIKKYEIKTVAEWIDITKDSIHSMTSKKKFDDSLIDNQDVIAMKDVADMEDLGIVADKEVEELKAKTISTVVTDGNEIDVNVTYSFDPRNDHQA